VSIYHLLRDQVPYQDLGPHHFDRLHADRVERHDVRRLEALGFAVQLTPASSTIAQVVAFSPPNRAVWEQDGAVPFLAVRPLEFSGETPSAQGPDERNAH
jgi:hypothetical protein